MNKIFNKKEILTIPNLLSVIRLILIPIIVWLYVVRQNNTAATVMIILSGITDIADGIIARKFDMVSDLGKILDPIADKLTQGAIIICLSFKYPLMIFLVVLFVLKEIIMAYLGVQAIKKQDFINGAKWHGKMNTVIIYATMIIMIFFPHLPKSIVNIMIILCCVSMIISLSLYARFYIRILRNDTK